MSSFINKNLKAIIITTISIFIIVMIILIVKNKNTPKPTVKENYEDEDSFYLSNIRPEDFVENFPQPAPMNVMYSDANGNLATTTDLGLQNLTIAGGKDAALLLGNKFRFNANKDFSGDDEWLRMSNADNTGYSGGGKGGFAAQNLYAADTIYAQTSNIRGNSSVAGNSTVNGNSSISGNSSVSGISTTSNINIRNGEWGANHEGNDKSYIVSDNNKYKKLMLVGNNLAGGAREVGVWDNLTVNGSLSAVGLSAGSISTGGALSAGSISTGGALSAGSISTGGNASVGSITVGGVNIGSSPVQCVTLYGRTSENCGIYTLPGGLTFQWGKNHKSSDGTYSYIPFNKKFSNVLGVNLYHNNGSQIGYHGLSSDMVVAHSGDQNNGVNWCAFGFL